MEPTPDSDPSTDHQQAKLFPLDDLNLDRANLVILGALDKARELNIFVNVAVVDSGANLKAFARMDGAWLGSIDIAIKKAKTSRLFDRSTEDLGRISQPGGPIYGVEHSNDGLITFAGGMVVRNKLGTIVGAVGVSGGTIESDRIIVEAAVKAWEESKCL